MIERTRPRRLPCQCDALYRRGLTFPPHRCIGCHIQLLQEADLPIALSQEMAVHLLELEPYCPCQYCTEGSGLANVPEPHPERFQDTSLGARLQNAFWLVFG